MVKSNEDKNNMNKKDVILMLSDMLLNRCTNEVINELKENEVFVFGSKPNGHHKSGAAKTALEKYGAIEGKENGFSGQCYAIPVHKEKTVKMDKAVKDFRRIGQNAG